MADRVYLLCTIDVEKRWNPFAGKVLATFETPEDAAHELLRRGGDGTRMRVMRLHPATGKPYWLDRTTEAIRVHRILYPRHPKVPA